MEKEDALVARQVDEDHAAIYGGGGSEPTASPLSESEGVGNKYMVAGNMTVTHPSTTTQQTARKGIGPLATMLIVAALLAGAGGAGYVAYDLLHDDPKFADTDTDSDTITEIDFPNQ